MYEYALCCFLYLHLCYQELQHTLSSLILKCLKWECVNFQPELWKILEIRLLKSLSLFPEKNIVYRKKVQWAEHAVLKRNIYTLKVTRQNITFVYPCIPLHVTGSNIFLVKPVLAQFTCWITFPTLQILDLKKLVL